MVAMETVSSASVVKPTIVDDVGDPGMPVSRGLHIDVRVEVCHSGGVLDPAELPDLDNGIHTYAVGCWT